MEADMSKAANSIDLIDTETGSPVNRSSASAMAVSTDSMGSFFNFAGMGSLQEWTGSDEQMRELMKFLLCTYGTKFNDQWRGVTPRELRAMWASALQGYKSDEVQRGLSACLNRIWPPTLPEFLQLCRPPIDHESAFVEANHQIKNRDNGTDRWSHPAIYWAAVEFGFWDLSHTGWDRAKSRWTKILDGKLAQKNLPPVPSRPASLPAPKASAEVVDAEMAKIASEALGAPKDGQGYVDHRRWAKALKKRHDAGEKLNLCQVNAYRVALGLDQTQAA